MKLLTCFVLTLFGFGFNCISSPMASAYMDENQPIQKQTDALKIGVVGLVHTHVHWVLGRPMKRDIEIVGIVEPNRELAKRYSRQHGYSMDIVFDSIDEMIEEKKPEAVTAFNNIFDHLSVVKYCAPRGIHVMVEKPLAVSLEHANKMYQLAQKHKIQLLTNYETSWYPTTRETFRVLNQQPQFSPIKKINFYTGHEGPIEIGCNREFVDWLIDPKLSGGGALTDFGCYGANLATWILQGALPTSVTCVTRQNKPSIYPEVEDDATIILNYKKTQVLIQASWNWSHNRKEMELFGNNAFIKCLNGSDMSILLDENNGPVARKVDGKNQLLDPFSLFQKIVKEDYKIRKFDTLALDNNLIVMQILEAAKISAREKRTVRWDEVFK